MPNTRAEATPQFDHSCDAENASKFYEWITTRGGLAVWHSVNLSNCGASWTTPAKTEHGLPMGKPTWEAGNEPVIHTDPARIGVYTAKEVKRFRVALRRAGTALKVTDAGSRKIRAAVEKAGDNAFYRFDYGSQEAVICITGDEIPLPEWIAQQEKGET
jgi:hypothetical protein